MRILISNDDGINARGIKVLSHHLALNKNLEVFVVAPDRERSATGHALTLHKPLRVEEVDLATGLKGAWCTSGTPSDCVKLATGTLLNDPPDLVISGINGGANLGSEVLYSGTVSAAMEGAISNIPSIAVSLVGHKHFETAAQVIEKLLDILPSLKLSPRTLLNVNVPNLPIHELKGFSLTELGIRNYNVTFEKRNDPRHRVYYWLVGEVAATEEAVTTDVWAVSQGYVSITPIAFNMTDRQTLETLKNNSALHTLLSTDSLSPCSKISTNTISKD